MKNRSEEGQIIILIVIALVGVLGFVALAVDGGQLYSERRTVQNAADNAAMAGAQALCQKTDPATASYAAALSNGFDNNGTTNTVAVNHPPASGPNAGENEYIEIRINSVRQPFFAQLIYDGEFEASARAVGRCRKSYDYAVLALTPRNDVRGLEVVGSGNLMVNDGGIMSNSTHPTQAVYVQDSHAAVTAEVIHTQGGVSCAGICNPSPEAGMPYVADPLVGIPPPLVQSQPAQSTPEVSGTCTTVGGHPGLAPNFSGTKTITLNPGMYCYIKGDAGVMYVLNPGIYYIDGYNSGGYGIEVKGNSSISGSGIMIYMSPNAGRVYMYGNASVGISACKSSDVGAWCVGSNLFYSGMLFYADRSYTRSVSMIGNAQWNATGTIYAAGSPLDLSGNTAVTNLSSMVVANVIRLGGDSSVVVNYDPGLNVASPTTVSLVE